LQETLLGQNAELFKPKRVVNVITTLPCKKHCLGKMRNFSNRNVW